MSSSLKSLEDFKPDDTIFIGNSEYIFVAKPHRPKKIDLRPGKQAFVAQLKKKDNSEYFALKSFHDKFNHPSIVERGNVVKSLSQHTPGLKAAKLQIIDPNSSIFTFTISSYPFLKYAVLMPWLSYPTWTGLRSPFGRENYSLPDYPNCRKRALNLAILLNFLWSNSTAHCDICPSNIIIGKNDEVFLIDFENIFHHSLTPPPWGFPFGQDGYRHHYVESTKNQWCLNGDLFGGALLIAELLTWYNPDVREHSLNESFVNQADLHNTNNKAFKILKEALQSISQECANMFDRAWTSKTLDDCPRMEVWARVIANLPQQLSITQQVTTHSVIRIPRPRHILTDPISSPSQIPQSKSIGDKVIQSTQTTHVSGRRSAKPRDVKVSQHVKRRMPAEQVSGRTLLPVKPSPVPSRDPIPPHIGTPVSQPSQLSSPVVGTIFTILFVLLLIGLCIGVSIWLFS